MNWKKKREPAAARSGGFRALIARHSSVRGAYSMGLIAAAVAAVIVFNLIIAQIPTAKMQLDMTGSQIYNITDTSLDYLAELQEDVEIRVLADEDDVDSRIVRFLDKYVSLSDHLSLEYIDPDIYPSILTTYDTDAGSVVVSCEATGRQEIFALDDVFGYDSYDLMSYYYGNTSPTSFDCEGQLTSAIDGVINDTDRKLYATSGHDETALPDAIDSLFQKSHLSCTTVNLLTDGGVPEDCDLLILNAPTRDLADDELTMLREYLSGGGQMVITLAAQLDSQPNLEALLADYGMTLTDGFIADTQRYYSNNPYLIFPIADTSVDVASGLGSDSTLLMYYSRGMTISDPARDTISVSSFLTTSSSGVNVVDAENQTTGTYVLGAVATEDLDDGSQARLTVIGSDSLCSADILNSFTNLDNSSLFLSAVTCGFDDVTTLDIDPVTLSDPTNTITTGGLWSILFVLIIPCALLIGGLVRWLRRRKL